MKRTLQRFDLWSSQGPQEQSTAGESFLEKTARNLATKDSEARQTLSVTPLWEILKYPLYSDWCFIKSTHTLHHHISTGSWEVGIQAENKHSQVSGFAVTTQISEPGAGNDPAHKMSSKATYGVPCTSLCIMVIMSHQEKISLCLANY